MGSQRCRVCWCIPVILALKRQKQEDREFKTLSQQNRTNRSGLFVLGGWDEGVREVFLVNITDERRSVRERSQAGEVMWIQHFH
jgi:hypothetical protein